MQTRNLLTRIERAERITKTSSELLPDCTCFPPHEQPEFRWRAEAEAAATVPCPIHGLRFQVVVSRFLYRPLLYYLPILRAAGTPLAAVPEGHAGEFRSCSMARPEEVPWARNNANPAGREANTIRGHGD